MSMWRSIVGSTSRFDVTIMSFLTCGVMNFSNWVRQRTVMLYIADMEDAG